MHTPWVNYNLQYEFKNTFNDRAGEEEYDLSFAKNRVILSLFTEGCLGMLDKPTAFYMSAPWHNDTSISVIFEVTGTSFYIIIML